MTTKKKTSKKAAAKKKTLSAKKTSKRKTVKKISKKKIKNTVKITKDMSIAEVIRKYPETIEVFFNYDLHCVGCAASEFDTIESGAMVHGINVEYLLFDLNKIIK